MRKIYLCLLMCIGLGLVGCVTFMSKVRKTEKMVKYFKEGVEAYKVGQYSAARYPLSKAYSIDPTNEDLSLLVPRIKLVSEWIGAEVGTTQESEAIRTGIAYYFEGNINYAVMVLRYAYLMQPQNENLRRLLNKIEKEAGETHTPIAGTKVTLSSPLSLIERKQEKAREYIEKQQYAPAIDECQEILIIDPKNIPALKRMGVCYYQMGLTHKAIYTWQKVLEIDPANKEVIDMLRKFK